MTHSTMGAPARDPRLTRFHEAGHATIGVIGGWTCYSVTAGAGTAEYNGNCQFNRFERPLFKIDPPVNPEAQKLIRSRIQLKVAGEMSTLKLTGDRWPAGCMGDYHGAFGDEGAFELASWCVRMGDTSARSALISEVEREVMDMFVDTDTWGMVEALVVELEASPTMLFESVRGFFERFDVAMRPGGLVPIPGIRSRSNLLANGLDDD